MSSRETALTVLAVWWGVLTFALASLALYQPGWNVPGALALTALLVPPPIIAGILWWRS